MDIIGELQKWYLSQCNDDWEHTYGIAISNLDNPGWHFEVDLTDTYLEDVPFETRSYGMGAEADISRNEWLICERKDRKFRASGGPEKLHEMISIFLAWACANA
ncbi:immunity 53 family protein [Allohahella sp. A8]|uniref:immunity 53 family protein n=1 Tax=Allohahella sp. A8 TaxID=3141461 RepID=UPI003A7FE61B